MARPIARLGIPEWSFFATILIAIVGAAIVFEKSQGELSERVSILATMLEAHHAIAGELKDRTSNLENHVGLLRDSVAEGRRRHDLLSAEVEREKKRIDHVTGRVDRIERVIPRGGATQ